MCISFAEIMIGLEELDSKKLDSLWVASLVIGMFLLHAHCVIYRKHTCKVIVIEQHHFLKYMKLGVSIISIFDFFFPTLLLQLLL